MTNSIRLKPNAEMSAVVAASKPDIGPLDFEGKVMEHDGVTTFQSKTELGKSTAVD